MSKTWVTKEGISIEISKMATHHLLSTIHMIERNRLNNLTSIMASEAMYEKDSGILDYYSRWPDSYDALCEEAERRHLIRRGVQKPGLVKKKK